MPDSPAYLLLLASGIERQRFADYVSALSPMLHPLGGRHLAMAPAPLLEQFGHNEAPPSVLLSHWPSLDTLRAFWDSPQYKSLAKLRRGSGELLAVADHGSGCTQCGADEFVVDHQDPEIETGDEFFHDHAAAVLFGGLKSG